MNEPVTLKPLNNENIQHEIVNVCAIENNMFLLEPEQGTSLQRKDVI